MEKPYTSAELQETLYSCLAQMSANLEKCRQLFHEHGSPVHKKKGELLDRKRLYVLLSGRSALVFHDVLGDEVTIFYHQPGQLLNLMPIARKCFPFSDNFLKTKIPTDKFHVRILAASSLLELDKEWFIGAFASDVSVCSYLAYSCSFNLMNMYGSAYTTPVLTTPQRLGWLLLSAIADSPDNTLPVWLTHTEISSHLSIHPITVSKILGRLKHMGILERRDGKAVIIDTESLQAVARGELKISY